MHSRLTLCGMFGAFVLLFGLGGSVSFALWGELPNDKPYRNRSLPPSIVKAVNASKRVYGWSNSTVSPYDYCQAMYFKGDTRQLNAMLKAFVPLGKVKGSKVKARILSGSGSGERMGLSDIEDKSFAFNWSVAIAQAPIRSMVLKKQGPSEDGMSSIALEWKWEETGKAWEIEFEIHIDGKIDLGKLRLPLMYEVSTGGRIAGFVASHTGRREAGARGTTKVAIGPTSESASTGGGIFEGPPPFNAAQDLPGAMAQLTKVRHILLEQAGSFRNEGPYCQLRQVFIAKGDVDYYRKMIQSDNVVVRAMAMDCLMEKQGLKAVPTLKTRLSSRAMLSSESGGINGFVTEGQVVRTLMMGAPIQRKVTPQGGGESHTSFMVSGQVPVALDLEILSRNDMAAMHHAAGRHIARLIGTNELVLPIFYSEGPAAAIRLDLPAMRKQAEGMSDAAIIRAVGRVGAGTDCEDVVGFLIKCVNDTHLDAQSRLAAASALTRYGDDGAEKAVESNKVALDKLQAGAGTKIWNTFLLRKRYEGSVGRIRRQDTVADWLRLNDSIESVMKQYAHPMVWEEFRGFLGMFKNNAAKALLKVTQNLAAEIEPWNTYGNIPYLCEFALNTDDLWEAEAKREGDDPPELTLKRLLSPKEYLRLVDNVKAAIQAESKVAAGAAKRE